MQAKYLIIALLFIFVPFYNYSQEDYGIIIPYFDNDNAYMECDDYFKASPKEVQYGFDLDEEFNIYLRKTYCENCSN